MNKNDVILITIIIIICLIMLSFMTNSNSNQSAVIYYNDEIILEVPLNKKEEYQVNGYLGVLLVETDINKVRVKKETSPKHLCSLQGWVDNSYTPIICLPNRIVIKIKNSDNNIDTVVG